MKKTIVISTLIAAAVFNSFGAAATSKQVNIGISTGAITGAAVAGPIGFILGSAIGAMLGQEVEKSSRLDSVAAELEASSLRENQLKQEILMIQETMEFNQTIQANPHVELDWMTEGLSLNLMFTTNSADLSDDDLANIKQISLVLAKYPELNLKLDGYSDPRGSQADNLTLSENRVLSVKSAFKNFGIDSRRVLSEAHGESSGFKLEDGSDAFAMARKVKVNFLLQGVTEVAGN